MTVDKRTFVYSDSHFCVHALTNGHQKWKRNGWLTVKGEPVSNQELIKATLKLVTPNIAFQWVKGHVGVEHYERADELALLGRQNNEF